MNEPTPGLELVVLRAYAELQLEGEDHYEASGDVSATIGLSEEQFTAVIFRLVTGGYVAGGQTVAYTYVDTVSDFVLAVANARTTSSTSEALPPASSRVSEVAQRRERGNEPQAHEVSKTHPTPDELRSERPR
jgi:hypothetical protein